MWLAAFKIATTVSLNLVTSDWSVHLTSGDASYQLSNASKC